MPTPEATRRARANKRKGAQWQSDIRNKLRSLGHDIEILELSGAEDEGDLVVRLSGGRYVVIEAKNTATIDISGFLRQAAVEADNFAAHRPAVERGNVLPVAAVKARGKSTEDSYVLVRLGDFFEAVTR